MKLAYDEMNVFGFDRASVRTGDSDGRLHVAKTNISKANICPYIGREIPDFEKLGLEADKVYKLYRDPDELAKGAKTFNNLPVLNKHVPVSTTNHQPEHIIGTTGTDAEFKFPYLQNSMSFWRQDAIDDIEAEDRKELSSAYRYRADMTPGVLDGVRYDGVMRDIEGNHVALVKEGRAGSDVVVGDAKPLKMENIIMANKVLLSRKATLALGGVAHFLTPKLAADAKIDLVPAFAGVTSKNFKSKKAAIVTSIENIVKGKLANDATPEGLAELLDALEPIAVNEAKDAEPEPKKEDDEPDANDEEDDDEDDDPAMDEEGLKGFLKDKLSAEDMKACDEFFAKKANDEPPAFEGKPAVGGGKAKDKKGKDNAMKAKDKAKDAEPEVTKKAMDAAIKIAKDEVIKVQRDIRQAEADCRPYVGELDAIAFDSADQVYLKTFEMLGVDVEGVHPSAYKTILGMQKQPGQKKSETANNGLGMDAAATKSFRERNPNVARITSV